MNRTARLLVLALVAAPAIAAAQPGADVPPPVARLRPPPGWTIDDGRSAGLAKTVAGEGHFGGGAMHIAAQHLRAPTPGGILLTSQVITDALPADPGAVATAELHGVRGGVDALGAAKVVHWDVVPDAAARLAEARLEWRDDSLGTTSISRTLVFRTKAALVRLAAECIIADTAPALRGPCEASLATLAPLASVAEREPLDVSAHPPAPAPSAVPPVVPPPAPPAPMMRESLPGEIPTTLMVTAPQHKPDHRPYYVGAGLAVLALVFWWNRRERARLASAAERPAGEAPGNNKDDVP